MNPVSDGSKTDSQSAESLEVPPTSRSKRVSHIGEVEDVESA